MIYDVVPQLVAEAPIPGRRDWSAHHNRALFSGSMEDCTNFLNALPHAGARIVAHQCAQGESDIAYDARGIPLCRVCAHCRKDRLSKYRPEVLTDSNYDTFGEQIDEDY
jgi:hypothetical protein